MTYCHSQDVVTESSDTAMGNLITPGYPFTEAEILYSLRHEWVVKAEDVLTRRTRLAFLNKQAAIAATPKVVDIMGKELGWSNSRKQKELKDCTAAIEISFAGSPPTPIV